MLPRSLRRLVLFTKPAIPGRVKTRLVGDGAGELTAARAAALHQAFLDDLAERLLAAEARGELELWSAWALDGQGPEGLGAALPAGPGRSLRQEGATLGDRLAHGLSVAATGGAAVAALGSDHPTVTTDAIRDAFERLDAGADVALGPSDDGGYFLIAFAPGALRAELFDGVAWSTETVLAETLERAARLGLSVELLPPGRDVDTAQDLDRLAEELEDPAVSALCPRTRSLLAAWGRIGRLRAADAPAEAAP